MGRKRFGAAVLVVAIATAWTGPAAGADVAPGDVIDKTNWQKIEGLVPDPVLNWIKKGDVIQVGKLDYNLDEFIPPSGLATMTSNVGKYDIDDKDLIMEVKTGKLPKFIEGLPFPEIDPDDPKAAIKIMYNKHYYSYIAGHVYVPFQVRWVGRRTGYERELTADYWTYVYDGWSRMKDESNPENLEMHSIIRILSPYDIKGTNVLLWRYRNLKQDSTFAYVPAIRRVRRMSPANRSDAFVGSDFCVDDAWGYAGKICAFRWKLLKKVDQLVPICAGGPLELRQNDAGEWETVNAGQKVTYGYEKKDYGGAPWFPVDLVFVMRPTYIIECKAKDPYYNYGTQYLWIDAAVFTPTYKVIHDRANVYWKVEWQSLMGNESADKKVRLVGLGNMMAIDDRSQHACDLVLVDPKNTTRYFADLDRNDFSIAGFQKLCK